MEQVVAELPRAGVENSLSAALPSTDYKQFLKKKKRKKGLELSPPKGGADRKSPGKGGRGSHADGGAAELEEDLLLKYANPEKVKSGSNLDSKHSPGPFGGAGGGGMGPYFDEWPPAMDSETPLVGARGDDRYGYSPGGAGDYSPGAVQEDLAYKAEILSRLERKIRLHKLPIQIPPNASIEDYELMLHKVSYDQNSKIGVDIIKKLFIGVNCVVENAAARYPQMGLELKEWSEQVKAMCETGEYEELFYDVYDEYKEQFEVNPLYKLVFMTVGSMILYSQTQKLFKQIMNPAASSTGERQVDQLVNQLKSARPLGGKRDLEPPRIPAGRLDELRQQVEKKREEAAAAAAAATATASASASAAAAATAKKSGTIDLSKV